MIKYTILLMSTITLLISQFFFAEEMKVTQNLPATIKSNSNITVELTINKGDVKGFAKIEQELPEGLTALPLDMKGASFTFEKQKIKIIWMLLPSTKEFKITYTLKVAANEKGQKTIGGKVYFVKDNKKQILDITPSTVTIN
jgi:hypothetical protein